MLRTTSGFKFSLTVCYDSYGNTNCIFSLWSYSFCNEVTITEKCVSKYYSICNTPSFLIKKKRKQITRTENRKTQGKYEIKKLQVIVKCQNEIIQACVTYNCGLPGYLVSVAAKGFTV